MQPKSIPPAWDPESSVSYWINRTSRTILRLHDSRLRPLGLSMGQLPVLIALEEQGPLPQKDLAVQASVEQPTMAEQLARMERDGLVQREPNPADRRGSLISLTRLARARLAKAKAALLENEAVATAGLGAGERAALIERLQQVLGNVTRAAAVPEPAPAPRRREP